MQIRPSFILTQIPSCGFGIRPARARPRGVPPSCRSPGSAPAASPLQTENSNGYMQRSKQITSYMKI